MKLKRVISLLVVITIIITVFPTQTIVALESSQDSSKITEEKIYSKADLNGDFADNRVLVVLKKSESNMLRDHTIEDFSEVDVKEVRDLTENTKTMIRNKRREAVANNLQRGITSVTDIVQDSQFNQILSIELNTSGKANVLETIKKLESRDDILYVGPDIAISAASVEPNDPLYPKNQLDSEGTTGQWGHEKINLPSAWEITTGSSNVIVGVLDSGIDVTHEDLQNRIDTVLSYDFLAPYVEFDKSLEDKNGHGTSVASIIGAEGNNGKGISGVCWGVTLVSLKVLDDNGKGFSSYLLAAIDYATVNNIPILNFSARWDILKAMGDHEKYGEGEFENKYNIPVDFAIANYPGLFICAAGNDGKNVDSDEEEIYPAQYDIANMIVVANTTIGDSLLTYDGASNFGATTVHLAAPGTEIRVCTSEDLDNKIHTDDYKYLTGTSMAAPYVTGVAALIKSIRPDLTTLEIKALILDNVDIPVDDNGNKKLKDKCITEGRLNAYKAVRAATEAQTFTGDVNGDDRADVILSRNVGGMRALTVYLGQTNGTFSEPITTQSTRTFYYDATSFVGDFDGDGLTDVLVQTNDDGYRRLLVYRSKGDGSFYESADLISNSEYISNSAECSYHIADVNGDNKDDFVVQYRADTGFRNALVYEGSSSSPYLLNTTTNALVESLNVYSYSESIYIGDFNGDGMSDMLVHGVNSSSKRRFWIHVGSPDGTFMDNWILTSFQNYYPEQYPTKNYVADVDGDGYDDFVVQWKNDNSCISVLVYKGRSSEPYLIDATTDTLTSTDPYVETDPVFMGDIDGDGMSEMVVHSVDSNGYRRLYVYDLDETNSEAMVCNTMDIHNSSTYSERVLLADVNGDGRDDVIVKRKVSGKIQFMTYLGTTTGSFGSAVTTTPSTEISYYNSISATQSRAGTYKIINVGANKCLNVYGDNVTVLYNQQNVCLWEDSGTNEQKWYVTDIGNSQFIKSVINTNFGLNVYRAGNPWNCDLYPTAGNETDSLIDFIVTDDGFRIKLHNYDLYLTVGSSANGSNVYWSAFAVSPYQLWRLVSA